MWPGARISVMSGEAAVRVLATVKRQQAARGGDPMSDEALEDVLGPVRDKYARESGALYSTARLWDDGIIEPRQTRTVLGLALAAIRARAPADDPVSAPQTGRYGVFRM
jgi:3-methylcrotonyl-CoA carboxylase beta subunit